MIERIHAIGLPVTLVVPQGSESPTVMTVHARDPGRGVLLEPATPGATIGLIVSHFQQERLAALGVSDLTDRGVVLELVELG